MNILHHVKKHGKTITLHLKKHHKKYIFGILSATLLWKGVSLIAAYALVHNLSFSFADIIQGNETTIEDEIENNTEEQEKALDDENPIDNEENSEEYEEIGESTESEEDTNNEEETIDENPIIDEDPIFIESPIIIEEPIINEEPTIIEEPIEIEQGICDEGDIIITNPKAGSIVGKTFNITRRFTNEDCKNNSYLIKLRDSNDQYLTIFSGNSNDTGFSFDSTQLVTGFYTIMGQNESGDSIVLKAGKYEGKGTNYFSGHKIAIVSDEGETIYRIENGGKFTIDNKKPEITNIKVEYSTKNDKVNIGDTITISFESDEKLKDTTVNILGQYALLEKEEGNKYTYSMDFTENNTLGKIVYGIDFQDEVGNTGYIEGYESRELDYTKPNISDLSFTSIGSGRIKLSFNTNKKTDVNLIYQISGTNNTKSITDTGINKFQTTLEDINKTRKYNYSISIQDEAKNSTYIGGDFYLSGDEIIFSNKEIKKTDLLTEFGFTGEKENINPFKNNFSTCANSIKTKNLKIAINKQKTINVKIPEFKDSNTNKLTTAFISVLAERMENKNLPQYALDEIAEDLNKFLIIVKLVKDDNNECKQNMTEYYVNRFKKTLIKYGIVK